MKYTRLSFALCCAALLVVAGCSPIPPSPLLSPIPSSPVATPGAVASPAGATDSPLPSPTAFATVRPTDTPDPAKTPLVISGLEIGPDGHEILRLTNITAETVTLTGYSLYNPSSAQRYIFPEGTELASNETVEVHSGVGDPTVKDGLFWQEAPAWNGLGEDALLLTPAGALAYWYVYRK